MSAELAGVRAAVEPVMRAAKAYRNARGWASVECRDRLALTVALALAEARAETAAAMYETVTPEKDIRVLNAECTRLRAALGGATASA